MRAFLFFAVAILAASVFASDDTCVKISVGESRLVNSRFTGIESRYKLSQPEPGRYEIALGIDFVTRSGAPFTAPVQVHDREAPMPLRDWVSRCYSVLSPKLVSREFPHPLSLRLAAPDEIPESHRWKVVVDPTSHARGHSVEWSIFMVRSCPTILHESLHLLGLVDLYHENAMYFDGAKFTATQVNASVPAYSCRAEAPNDAVMADHSAAVEGAFPIYQRCTCACPDLKDPKRPACMAALSRLIGAPAKCPAPSEKFCDYKASDLRFLSDKVNREIYETDVLPYKNGKHSAVGYTFLYLYPAKLPSLIHGGEFRALVSPGCGPSRYTDCSTYAYTTRGFDFGVCDKRPAACGLSTDWLD